MKLMSFGEWAADAKREASRVGDVWETTKALNRKIYIYQSIYFHHYASMFLAPVVVKYLSHAVRG
jgi:hypothetical protein